MPPQRTPTPGEIKYLRTTYQRTGQALKTIKRLTVALAQGPDDAAVAACADYWEAIHLTLEAMDAWMSESRDANNAMKIELERRG